jgi:signal transduction histidine kinase
MMNGKNEWTESIMNQVKRMSGLVNDFISLARMNERKDIVLTDQDFSEIALDVTSSFKPVILNQGKKAVYNITEGVIIKGDEKLLHELVNILVDNAAKYCDDEGTVSVSLDFKGKNSGAKLIVSNT